MAVIVSKLLAGTLTFGATAFACQQTAVKLVPATEEKGDRVETLCGDIVLPEYSTKWSLVGTAIQDWVSTTGFIRYCYDNDLTEKTFSWHPNVDSPTWSGTVLIKALEIGGDVNTRLSSDWEFALVGTGIPTLAPDVP